MNNLKNIKFGSEYFHPFEFECPYLNENMDDFHPEFLDRIKTLFPFEIRNKENLEDEKKILKFFV